MWKMERDMEADACKWEEEEKRQEENAFKTFIIVIMLL